MTSTGPGEFQPQFADMPLSLMDVTYANAFAISPGPTVAEFHQKLPGFWEEGIEPLVTFTVTGMQLETCESGKHIHQETGIIPIMTSWAEAADCAASIAGLMETFPEPVRIRYLSRYDRSLVAWREAMREFRGSR